MGYLTLARFKLLALIPAGWIDEVEAMPGAAGFTEAQIDVTSDWLDAQLRKRYAAPFTAPIPGIVEQWVARLITPDVLIKRGVNATDEQFAAMEKRADQAREQIQQAADSETGLYDLPLRDDLAASGISAGNPRVYSEQSPYVYTDVQVDTARGEDESRRGSGV